MTVQEIAEKLNVTRAAADSLVKFLLAVGAAKYRGERPSTTGRGRGAKVYDVTDSAPKILEGALRRLREGGVS
jgi:predicted ArsR family transcriptional regulator